ncbi:undecaprenyldiphospho-muramoylpentapeptide beta-N-acetylglucosaminyltransferase [Rhodohalobacter mucosus]|uniref:UDP-N-acetylglucosamine--N-acetylmuramyl-(pentapeptide) pyrophosphoryl-undecaprenol N-acetylglucosamine transferase n=2 Tax=Rhodohalobacter mucosus TaxID=2079485 RepID=A0A316TRZ9_9BACT|nr:undecaprenyldiphospho-muramoylpentapeptide beta-N-acetylglucosaminyltransferase [Rhodohalobacter mucosus]
MDISSTDTLTAAGTPIRVLLAAGGTGGHVYPAIAIADAVKKMHPSAEILFVGTRDRMEWQTVPKAGYEIRSIWISAFHRRLTPQNLLFPVKLSVSLIQSYSILNSFAPDVVVACGGFASGPIGWVASKMNIPVVLQEQNSYPGVTNRMLAKHAAAIFTAFEQAEEHLPGDKVILSGNPVRKRLSAVSKEESLEMFGFSGSKKVLLVLGGSGGARAINSAMKENLEELHDCLDLQIIWQCGEKYHSELSSELENKDYPNLRLLPYIDNMPAAYGSADLVLTRAGASTCSELMLLGMPAILVPSPNVAGNHQAKNASAMVQAGAAEELREENLSENLSQVIKKRIFDDEALTEMRKAMKSLARPDAAKVIAKEIFTLAGKETQ